MNKKLPAVGDLHIHGIVNLNGFMEFSFFKIQD